MEVYGHVQGVGFRFLTMRLAKEMGVKGFVENRSDGSVYIEAMADGDIIAEFIKEVSSSLGPASHVENVKVTDDPLLKERNKFIFLVI